MTAAPDVAALFAQLDQWRHLPNYQLERRADIFFALFLRSFLATVEDKQMQAVVVPELPLLRTAVVDDAKALAGLSWKSVKVDYAVFTEDRRHVYFVELKTDSRSRRTEQDGYLAKAARMPFLETLASLISIANHSTAGHKYFHLLHLLERAGYLMMPAEVPTRLYPPTFSDAPANLFSAVTPTDAARDAVQVSVRYLQPDDAPFSRPAKLPEGEWLWDGIDVKPLGFAGFAKHVQKIGGPIGDVFHEYLVRWIARAAIDQPPSP